MRVLVTGATGFLGRHVVRQLLDRGDQVSALVRHTRLLPSGTQVFHGDIRRLADVHAACQNVEATIHIAAKVGDWGSYKEYYETNVLGTENVIQACQSMSVSKLVYCSTPSVVFDGEPIRDGDESLPYAKRFLSHYQSTKALAEQQVLAANDSNGLVTCALRPHAIWGVGDLYSVPRLLHAAKTGRLKIVGDGKNQVSMTHVSNAAFAHLQALDSNQVGGKAYFVNDPQPVLLWDWYEKILAAAGMRLPTSKISYSWATKWGRLLESVHGCLPFLGQPRITRYVAAILAQDHFFNTGHAQTDFGFRSIVSLDAEMEILLKEIHDQANAI